VADGDEDAIRRKRAQRAVLTFFRVTWLTLGDRRSRVSRRHMAQITATLSRLEQAAPGGCARPGRRRRDGPPSPFAASWLR